MPSDFSVLTTSSPADTLRLVTITLAPACARARAVSTPRPEFPPLLHDTSVPGEHAAYRHTEAFYKTYIADAHACVHGTCDDRCFAGQIHAPHSLRCSCPIPKYRSHERYCAQDSTCLAMQWTFGSETKADVAKASEVEACIATSLLPFLHSPNRHHS